MSHRKLSPAIHVVRRSWGKDQCRPICQLFAQLPLMVVAVLFGSIVVADEAVKELMPHGTVVDIDQQPIPDAQITLHRWDGVMSPALQTVTTDANGQFEFPPRAEDAYYYVIISKTAYAPMSPIVSADGPIKATMRPAVDSWIEVRNGDGEPLEGARIANLTIRTPENPQTYIWRGMEHLFGFEFLPSDMTGRLNLPPLPKGALVDLRVDHPQWAQAHLSNVEAADGHVGTAVLAEGVITTFEFFVDPRTPLTLDGLTCETMLLSESSRSVATLNRIPMRIVGDRIDFCAHPVTYSMARLKAPGVVITPVFDSLAIPLGADKKVRFLVRKTVNVSGRVLNRDGSPHSGAQVYGEIENLSPDGPVDGANEWTFSGGTETDNDGKFTVAAAPGRTRVVVDHDGFVTDREAAELEVQVEGSNVIPDFIVDKLEPVRGHVVNESGQPVPGAIVRIRQPGLHLRQPEVSDAQGKFEIPLPRIPNDPGTEKRRYELVVAAFIADQPLMGIARIDLRNADSLKNVSLVLRADSSPDELLSMEDNDWYASIRKKAAAEQDRQKYAAGERGQPAPALDGVAWFNTDARSLDEFRGRYVLLDFWFIGCGPCHADFPSVKLVHEWFEKHGVTVIGVHDNSSTPEAVQEHCKQYGLTFPIVVDHPDARILKAYAKLGVTGFPSYILIGPDGNILQNDDVTDAPSLRVFKNEVIRNYILNRAK